MSVLVSMKLAFQREVRANVHVRGKGVREVFVHCNATRTKKREMVNGRIEVVVVMIIRISCK